MNFYKEHIILIAIAVGLIALGILTGCASVPKNEDRFTEPIRSQMMMQLLMSGAPITLGLCWEEELVKQGIKHPKQISRDAFEKAQKQCEKSTLPAVKEEINKAMVDEENSKSI